MPGQLSDCARVGDIVEFEYRNHRNDVRMRKVYFIGIEFGSTQWYSEPQFFLRGMDLERHEHRSFAFAEITPHTFRVLR